MRQGTTTHAAVHETHTQTNLQATGQSARYLTYRTTAPGPPTPFGPYISKDFELRVRHPGATM
jgi:hypothetical protein